MVKICHLKKLRFFDATGILTKIKYDNETKY